MSDFQLSENATFTIVENKPFIGRLTLLYTPPGSFTARIMEVSERAFLKECNKYADRKAARAERMKARQTVEQSAELPPRTVAAPLQPRKLSRPQPNGA